MDAALVRELMKDADPQVRVQAIRASETLYKAGDRSLAADYKAAATDRDADVAIQALLTSKLFAVPDLAAVVQSAQAANVARGVQEIGKQILNPPREFRSRRRRPRRTPAVHRRRDGDDGARRQGLQRAVLLVPRPGWARRAGQDGGPPGATMAPSLADVAARARSPRLHHQDAAARDDRAARGQNLSGGRHDAARHELGRVDRRHRVVRAQQLRQSQLRSSPPPTSRGSARRPARATTMWTFEELEASQPRLLVAEPTWKVTASHNPSAAPGALTFTTWRSGRPASGPACGSRSSCRTPSRWRKSSSSRRGRAVAAAAGDEAQPCLRAARRPRRRRASSAGWRQPPASPRRYKVEVSSDGATWSAPVAEGEGTGQSTVIAFAPVRAKFVRITQTGDRGGRATMVDPAAAPSTDETTSEPTDAHHSTAALLFRHPAGGRNPARRVRQRRRRSRRSAINRRTKR